MGQTTPDLLPWPENGDPAMVPQDMQELATATQTGLDKRMPVTPTTAAISAASNWQGNGTTVSRSGRTVVAGGTFTRLTNLTVADNTEYQIGTIPTGYRPAVLVRATCPWKAADSDGTGQVSTAQITIDTAGAVKFTANFAGTVRAAGDFVGVGALVWTTP